MDKLSSHIKPCPFCGTKPFYGGYPGDVRIECQQCRQAVVKAAWYGGDLGTMEASWNKRMHVPDMGNGSKIKFAGVKNHPNKDSNNDAA